MMGMTRDLHRGHDLWWYFAFPETLGFWVLQIEAAVAPSNLPVDAPPASLISLNNDFEITCVNEIFLLKLILNMTWSCYFFGTPIFAWWFSVGLLTMIHNYGMNVLRDKNLGPMIRFWQQQLTYWQICNFMQKWWQNSISPGNKKLFLCHVTEHLQNNYRKVVISSRP